MLRRLNPLLLTALLIPVVITLLGGCRHHSPEEKTEFLVAEISDRLDLDAAQEEQLNQMAAEILDKTAPMRDSRGRMFDSVLEQFGQEEIDETQLLGMALDRLDDFEALLPFFMAKLEEFHKMLTPQQREKLIATAQRMKDRRGCPGFSH